MKNIQLSVFIFCILAVSLFGSCKKNADDGPTPEQAKMNSMEQELAGKWMLKEEFDVTTYSVPGSASTKNSHRDDFDENYFLELKTTVDHKNVSTKPAAKEVVDALSGQKITDSYWYCDAFSRNLIIGTKNLEVVELGSNVLKARYSFTSYSGGQTLSFVADYTFRR